MSGSAGSLKRILLRNSLVEPKLLAPAESEKGVLNGEEVRGPLGYRKSETVDEESDNVSPFEGY